MRWRIHNVLVVAEKDVIGACLEEVLREHGLDVTVAESFGGLSDGLCDGARENIDLAIITNSSLPPSRIPSIVPDIKARHPDARLIVLSGYYTEDFVAELVRKGIDRFLTLPYAQDALLNEVDGLLSMPTP
jgi:two-component system, cell cycle sensor histidine kinase and response regulator CckA